jgi:S-adenosylmethionine synthetase
MNNQMKDFLFTSESVTEGHPDKVCDQISDAILDTYLEHDPNSRCAIECLVTKNQLIIAGEVSANVYVHHSGVARKVIADIGYTDPELGFYDGCKITDLVHKQTYELNYNVGAGDQGIMFGYACDQTEELMPLPIVLAHRLTYRLSEARKKNIVLGLLPDGKAQVTVKYENGKPVMVDTIIISAHHWEEFQKPQQFNKLKRRIVEHVVRYVIPRELITKETKVLINPLGPWINGGPAADTGLTGRKIIADTYGGWAKHGGGAFSGKDPSKVDRSGAYMARFIAKTIVNARLAEQCEIQLSFAIGKSEPVSLYFDTFGTEKISKDMISKFIDKNFDLSVIKIIDFLELNKPIYRKLSNYGHFGRDGYAWEKVGNGTKKNDKHLSMLNNPNYYPNIKGCFRESIKSNIRLLDLEKE